MVFEDLLRYAWGGEERTIWLQVWKVAGNITVTLPTTFHTQWNDIHEAPDSPEGQLKALDNAGCEILMAAQPNILLFTEEAAATGKVWEAESTQQPLVTGFDHHRLEFIPSNDITIT